MHILIGLLTALATLLFLLDRMGVDIGWLNPFSWARRRAWAKKYEGDPVYSVDQPMEVAGILVTGVAKLAGDLGADEKAAITGQFRDEFSIDEKGAAELLTASAHLLGVRQVIAKQLEGVADRHAGTFSTEQRQSLVRMMEQVAASTGDISDEQRSLIDKVRGKPAAAQASETWT